MEYVSYQQRIRGQIERITFTNQDTGYTVARVKVAGRQDLITVVGNLINPQAGTTLEMTGEWLNHPKFGEQFRIISYEYLAPATIAGIEKRTNQRHWP